MVGPVMGEAEAPVQRPPGGIANGGGVGEDLPHPLVRLEWPALDEADGGKLPGEFQIVAVRRLRLHAGVDHLENEMSLGGMVLNDVPLPPTNLVSGTGGLPASRTEPSSAVAMPVP